MFMDGHRRKGCTRRRFWLVFLVACLLPASFLHAQGRTDAGNNGPAQFGDLVNTRAREGPIDIASQGGTTYSTTPAGRVATGTNNVVITTDDAVIYFENDEYNLDS